MADSVTGTGTGEGVGGDTGGEPPTKKARHGDGDDQRISPDMAKLYSRLETLRVTWPDEFADVFAANIWPLRLAHELVYLSEHEYPMKNKVTKFYKDLINRAGIVFCDKVDLKSQLDVLLADSDWDRVA
jgi:hypothetical protein